MKLKLLNNSRSIDSDFSDFENHKSYSIYFNPKQKLKTLIYESKYSSTYKFKSNQKWLCVKILNKKYINNSLYVSSFQNEFAIGFELIHPNIIQYYNLVIKQDSIYIIKEYVDGFVLKDYFSQFISTKAFFIGLDNVLDQIMNVLNYLHSKQIYHLDLKPANILVTSKGKNVKLIDFGFSTRDNQDYYPSGTKYYSSPEQIKTPNSIDGRSDIYALGKILEELIQIPKRKGFLYFLFGLKYKRIIKKCISTNQNNRFQNTLALSAYSKRISLFNYRVVYVLFGILCLYLVLNQTKTTLVSQNLKATNVQTNKRDISIKKDFKNSKKRIKTKKNIFKDSIEKKHKSVKSSPIIKDLIAPKNNDTNFLKIKDIKPSNFQTSKFIMLSVKDKLFCETIIDSLHLDFIKQLALKPENIDSNLILFKYRNNLQIIGSKKLHIYNAKYYNDDKVKYLALYEYYELLKKKKFQKIK